MRTIRLVLALLTLAAALIASAEGQVVGKMGQTLKSAPIFVEPNQRGRTYYTAQPFEYIVIAPSKWDVWFKVLMSNGVWGYVRSENVATLPYDVSLKPEAAQRARTQPVAGGDARAAIANYGLKYTGTRYVWGGNDLNNGIDCSGFVQQLYGKIGIRLPRTAAEQALVGQPITRLEDLKPGDRLYFWSERRNKIGHTGLYLGNGYFVHSSSNNRGVDTDSLLDPTWSKILVAARR